MSKLCGGGGVAFERGERVEGKRECGKAGEAEEGGVASFFQLAFALGVVGLRTEWRDWSGVLGSTYSLPYTLYP